VNEYPEGQRNLPMWPSGQRTRPPCLHMQVECADHSSVTCSVAEVCASARARLSIKINTSNNPVNRECTC